MEAMGLDTHPTVVSPKGQGGLMPLVALVLCSLLHTMSAARAQPPAPHHVSLDELAGAITEARQKLLPLIGHGDLIQSLYFGWFDRPYQRAALAAAVKTVAVLECEQKQRRSGNGAIDDSRLRRLIDWLETFDQVLTAPGPRPGFRPHQLPLDIAEIRAILSGTEGAVTGPALFGFSDRTTATQHDNWLGDFDLLAAMGFRVIGLSPTRPEDRAPGCDTDQSLERERHALLRRAEALGIAVVSVASQPDDAISNDNTTAPLPVALVPARLADFTDPDRDAAVAAAHGLWALTDAPAGESWHESLARRALYRGATSSPWTVVAGWRPPTHESGPGNRPAQISAAMWAHALDGQRLALLEGWCVPGEGSDPARLCTTFEPANVQAAAFAALDLLYYRDLVALFDRRPRVALAVGPHCLRPDDSNRWSSDYAALFAALVAGQIRFDVVPRDRLADRSGDVAYDVVILPVAEPFTESQTSSLASLEAAGIATVHWHPGRESVGQVALAVADHLSRRGACDEELVIRDPDGNTPANLLVFHGRESAVGVVSLATGPTAIRITARRAEPTPALRDALSGQTFRHPDQGVSLRAWQVRILVPAGRR